MQDLSPMLAVKWHVFATRSGIFLNLNGTPVFVCSQPVTMAPGWSTSGRADIPTTPRRRLNESLPTPDEIAGLRHAPDSRQLTLPLAPVVLIREKLSPPYSLVE